MLPYSHANPIRRLTSLLDGVRLYLPVHLCPTRLTSFLAGLIPSSATSLGTFLDGTCHAKSLPPGCDRPCRHRPLEFPSVETPSSAPSRRACRCIPSFYYCPVALLVSSFANHLHLAHMSFPIQLLFLFHHISVPCSPESLHLHYNSGTWHIVNLSTYPSHPNFARPVPCAYQSTTPINTVHPRRHQKACISC